MQSPEYTIPEANNEEIQTFSQWSSKRFEVYQQVEQQTQTSITQILQLARDLTTRMEDEAAQLLARYQQERAILQAEVEDLHHEVYTLQQERVRLTQELEQTQNQIAQNRTQIETERQAALADRQQIIRNAYAERDRILAETYEFVQKIVGEGALATMPALQLTPMPPLSARVSHTTPPTPTATTESPVSDDDQTEYAAVVDDDAVAAEPAPTSSDDLTNGQEETDSTLNLVIEGVESFILASELIDRFDEHAYTEEVNLTQYEQRILQLAVQCSEGVSLEEIIRTQFQDTLTLHKREGATLYLRYSV